jgi:hypothetical protein
MLYFTKPNGLVLPADDNDRRYLGHWERAGLLMLNSEFHDGYVQHRIKIRVAGPGTRLFLVNMANGEKPAVSLQIQSGGKLVFDGALPDRVVPEEGRP